MLLGFGFKSIGSLALKTLDHPPNPDAFQDFLEGRHQAERVVHHADADELLTRIDAAVAWAPEERRDDEPVPPVVSLVCNVDVESLGLRSPAGVPAWRSVW
jgi:hypothetical protein